MIQPRNDRCLGFVEVEGGGGGARGEPREGRGHEFGRRGNLGPTSDESAGSREAGGGAAGRSKHPSTARPLYSRRRLARLCSPPPPPALLPV